MDVFSRWVDLAYDTNSLSPNSNLLLVFHLINNFDSFFPPNLIHIVRVTFKITNTSVKTILLQLLLIYIEKQCNHQQNISLCYEYDIFES